jgi:hypothetical protein
VRLRLGIDGKLCGLIPVRWTLIAKAITATEEVYAEWAKGSFDRMPVKAGPLRGAVFVEITAGQ